MKPLLLLPFAVLTLCLSAQIPANDNCSGAVSLGIIPYCSAPAQFTNFNATTSQIGAGNVPLCFNNNSSRDVWFKFNLPPDGSITDVSISVSGNISGNGTLNMPQVALYRGSCIVNGLAELACAAAPLNVNEVQLDFSNLDPAETYFLRINDYSPTAAPNWGSFRLCVEAMATEFNLGDAAGSMSCEGTLWDSGGPDQDYSSDESLQFKICPTDFHQCIRIELPSFISEEDYDFLRIFNGDNISGTLIANLSGVEGGKVFHVPTTGCVTLQMLSDVTVQEAGFELHWQCSPDVCPAEPPILPSPSTCATALVLNGCDITTPNVIRVAPGAGDANFLVPGTNAGCIEQLGVNLIHAFFYFRANADGQFAFLVKNGDLSNPSDIDFSVWGPIDSQAELCGFVDTHQPVRSSWTAAPTQENEEAITGLTGFDPYTGGMITDDFDCGSPATPGTGNLPTDDSFVRPLPVQVGKYYVVFLDDFDGAIEGDDGIVIDFSETTPGVLDPLPGAGVFLSDDITACPGQPVQLTVSGGLDYAWAPAGSLSCTECSDPFATPEENTTYIVQAATTCRTVVDSVQVNLFNLDLGPDANLCVGGSFTLNEHPVEGSYLWFGAPGLSCDTCPSPVFTATTSGIFNLVCIVTTPFCSDTDLIKINVGPGLQPQLNMLQDTAVCVGELLSLGGGPANYQYVWSSNPPGFSSTQAAPPAFSAQNSTTYYVLATSPFCVFPRLDSVVVSVYQPPTLDLISSALLCLGDSVQLGHTLEQPEVTYQWTPDDGSLSDPTAANPWATPTSVGTFIYTVTASNPGCTSTGNVPVAVSNLQLSWNVADTVRLCKGESLDIQVTVEPAGAGPVSWSPLQDLIQSPDGLTATVSPQIPRLYMAKVVTPGCMRSLSVQVELDSLPQYLGVTPDTATICLGDVVQYKAVAGEPPVNPANFPNIAFQWTPSTGLLDPANQPFVRVQPSDTITYIRTVTNGACQLEQPFVVYVVQAPSVDLSVDHDTVCLGEKVQLTAVAPGFSQIQWTGAVDCDDCLSTSATPATSTTYYFSGSFGACMRTDSIRVVVIAPPKYEFPTDLKWCSGETITLNSIDDPSVSEYHWSSQPTLTIPPGSQPEVLLQGTGIKEITFYLEADNGCAVKDSFTIEQAGVEVTLSPPATVCPETELELSALVSNGGGQFSWSTGETTQVIAIAPLTTTEYTVSYTWNDCVFSQSVLITVQGNTPVIDFPDDFYLCPGDSIVLNESAGNQGDMYQWSSDIGGFSSSDDIPPAQFPNASTVYTVTATSSDGCSVTKSLQVTVFTANLSVSDDVKICAGEPFTVSAAGSATGTYEWMPNDATTASFTDTLLNEQTVQYSVIYTFGLPFESCQLKDTVMVMTLKNFNIKIVSDPDSVFDAGDPLALDAVIQPSQSVNGFTFEWVQNNTEPVGNTQQIELVPATLDSIIQFTVTVASPNGCSQEKTISLRVRQPFVKIPNAFTPNGDGSNDVFRLTLIEGKVKVEQFEIYDRWGKKVFFSNAPDAFWDGTIDGKDASSDVYVYRIRYRLNDGSLKLETNQVTLLR